MYEAGVYSRKEEGSKKVAANFTVKEFACKDGSDVVLIHPQLAEILQKIRNYFKVPVTITSGHRTESYNKKAGGEKGSQHLYGAAADIQVKGVSPANVAACAETLLQNKGGIGTYSNFVHIDVRDKKVRWKGR